MQRDPHEVLGVGASASREDVARAYRELAKRFHPDRAADDVARAARTARMAEVNAAKDALLGRWDGGGAMGAADAASRSPGAGREGTGPGGPSATVRRAAPVRGEWLAPEVRAALAGELIAALRPGEEVHLVVRTAMSDSHEVQLAATGDRLLWLRDDAISDRVRSLSYDRVAALDPRRSRLLRRDVGELRVLAANGRRFVFGELSVRALDALVVTLLRLAPPP